MEEKELKYREKIAKFLKGEDSGFVKHLFINLKDYPAEGKRRTFEEILIAEGIQIICKNIFINQHIPKDLPFTIEEVDEKTIPHIYRVISSAEQAVLDRKVRLEGYIALNNKTFGRYQRNLFVPLNILYGDLEIGADRAMAFIDLLAENQ